MLDEASLSPQFVGCSRRTPITTSMIYLGTRAFASTVVVPHPARLVQYPMSSEWTPHRNQPTWRSPDTIGSSSKYEEGDHHIAPDQGQLEVCWSMQCCFLPCHYLSSWDPEPRCWCSWQVQSSSPLGCRTKSRCSSRLWYPSHWTSPLSTSKCPSKVLL